MTIRNAQIGVPVLFNNSTNCSQTVCPDFSIKRHDTYPPFRVSAEDCNGPLRLCDYDDTLVLEASMWSTAKLKYDLTNDSTASNYTYFELSGGHGFDQIMVNDIIVMDRVRLPEQMLVIGFDEVNKLVHVQRGYHGTPVSYWKRGNCMKIFRMLNATMPQTTIEHIHGEEVGEDGSTRRHVLKGTYLVYKWTANDTCLPGLYMLEFKLIKMTPTDTGISGWDENSFHEDWINYMNFTGTASVYPPPSYTPSFTPSTANYDGDIGSGVEWARRFPVDKPGFLIQILDTPTSESIES